MSRLSGYRSGRPPNSLPCAPFRAQSDPLPTDPGAVPPRANCSSLSRRRSPELSGAPGRAQIRETPLRRTRDFPRGRRRARIVPLLLACAALFGAASASAQTTDDDGSLILWEATLTVGSSGGVGFVLGGTSPYGSLSNNTFTYSGVTRTVNGLYVDSSNTGLYLQILPKLNDIANATLHVASGKYAFADGNLTGVNFLDWSSPPSWSKNDSVTVKLTKAQKPSAPRLTAQGGPRRIDLSWSGKTGGSLIGYRIEVSIDGTDGSWTDLVESTTETTYSHTGLSATARRYYRVSATNAIGTGPTSSVVGETPVAQTGAYPELLPVQAATVAESGDPNNRETTMTFTVAVDLEPDFPVGVHYKTEDVDAIGGASCSDSPIPDYISTEGRLTFGPGVTSHEVEVTVCDDGVEDSGETFRLVLKSTQLHESIEDLQVRGTIREYGEDEETASGTGTITNDETTTEVSIAADAAYVEEGTEAAFTLRRTGDAEEALTVPVSVVEDGAALGAPAPANVTFAAGLSQAALRVPTDDDGAVEADSTVTVTLAAGFTYQLAAGAASASLTVLDDDAAPVTSTSAADVTVWSADMKVVEYGTGSIGAGAADLFSNQSGRAGLRAKWLWHDPATRNLKIAFDGGLDDAESLTLHVGDLSVGFPADSGGNSSFTIGDVDVSWTGGETLAARVSKPSAEAVSTDATLKSLTVSGATLSPVFDAGTLLYAAVVDSATASVTVSAESNEGHAGVAFAPSEDGDAGQAGHQVAAPVGETLVTVTVTAADGRTQRAYRVIVTRWPTVAVSFGSASHTAVEGGAAATVSVALDADPGRDVTIPLTASPAGGAAAADYTVPAGVTFAGGGALSQDVEVAAVADDTAEEGESVVLGFGDLPDGVEAGTTTSAAVTLADTAPEAVNTEPAGSPAITGTEQVGETLTADTSAITDADGLENATYAYQWIANNGSADAAIADATQSTYEVAAADEGKTLKVRVTFTDDGGTEETLVSEATEAIAARPNAAPAGSPAISGTEQVGETLTADTSAITDADGLDNATYAYQWIANNGSVDADIADATQSTYEVAAADEGKTLKVRVTFTDDGDTEETLVSEATDAVAPESEPLTASFEGMPSEHDGENIFTFRLRFSEAPAVSYTVLRDESFAVTGGTVKKARRVNGRNDLREIHVEPTGYGDVTLTLAGGRACGTTGAICTADERELSNTLTATIRGPATLSVADARTQEGPDATVDFTVTLSRSASGTVSVDYTTQDGSATAGADYTTASDTLTFSSNQTSKTVSVTVLDDDHDDDGETFTLRLSNASGAAVVDGTATGTIENADPMPAAWLVRFGRTSATQVVGLLNARFDEVAMPSSQLTLGGRSWRLSALRGGADRVSGGADVPATILSGQAGFSFPAASTGLAGAGAHSLGDGAAWSDAAPAPSAAPNPNGVVTAGGETTLLERTVWGLLTESAWQVDKRQFISRSSFDMSLSDLGNDPDESIETVAASPDVPGHWSLWGRGALTHFGGVDDGVSLDGDVLTGLLGLDYARDRWLAGVALAYHDGDGSYRSARRGDAGELDSALVSVNPYLRYALTERLSVWGALGYGQGTLRLRPERDATVPQESIETDMQMGMGALGLRGTVYASEHTELALKSDALWVRTSSEDAPGLRAVDNADTSRIRLLLSGRHQRALANDAVLTPTVELGLRYDDGDAERGFGMELGGGLRYADPVRGLALETRARALLAHEDGGYEEWGVGGSLALDPGRLGRGLALRLDSGWGITDSGTDALWQRQSTAGLARQHDTPAQGRITAEMGYGLDVPYSYGILTPYGSVELAGGGSRTLRLGWRFELGQRLSLSLAGERHETAHARPEHGLMLRGSLPW